MYLQIDEEIKGLLGESLYYDTINNEELYSFGPINTVNILVGANNSGKSRLLRALFNSTIIIETNNKIHLKNELERIKNKISGKSYADGIELVIECSYYHTTLVNDQKQDIPYIYENFVNIGKNEIKIPANLITNINNLMAAPHSIEKIRSITELVKSSIHLLGVAYEFKFKKEFLQHFNIKAHGSLPILNIAAFLFELLNKLYVEEIEEISSTKVYVPILRSTINLIDDNGNKLSNNIFKSTVQKLYNINSKLIYTGLDYYNKIKSSRNEVRDIRKSFEAFEKFIGKTFFNTEDIDIIAKEDGSVIEKHILIYLNKEERYIHHLGDGIQSILLLFYPIFTAENDTWFFIEEPEINLHPGMQRILIENISKNEYLKSKNLKFFITTHSNHLLDLSLEINNDISIFTSEKKIMHEATRFDIKNVKNGDTDILSLLGVKNSSVFMANCSIWVEGITDRFYIREFLIAYDEYLKTQTSITEIKIYREDLHYSFFEYAGSNVMHYIFEEPEKIEDEPEIKAQLLSNKIFLISDKDMDKDPKHQLFEGQQNKNFHYEYLAVKEIENILSPKQLSKYLPLLFDSLADQSFTERDFIFEEYKDEFLGNYLKNKYGNLIKQSYVSKSNALSTYYKNKLANIIRENGIDWNELSEPAKNLTKSLYDFIVEANR